MQDLSIAEPFFLAGLAMVAVALVFARQTALSARKLDVMIGESRKANSTRVSGDQGIIKVNINAPIAGGGAPTHHAAPSVENIPN